MKYQPALSLAPAAVDRTDLLLVVVGAHLSAEKHDRATAQSLCAEAARRIAGDPAQHPGPLAPLTCTDVWYLNDPSLRECPVVCIGAPEVNALTAYLADKLPSAFAIDGVLTVQMDVEHGDPPPLAACWGIDHAQTARAVDVFTERYLAGFLAAAGRR